MKIAFFAAAAIMVAMALGLLLWPLLRQGRRNGQNRSAFIASLMIALVLPLATGTLYLLVGTPAALNGVATQSAAPLDLPQAMAELRAHLATEPDDLQGWTLLAQTSAMLRDSTTAREAYDHVLRLAPNNAEAMVGWAEADSIARGDHLIQGRALDLLKRAVEMHPDNQRGLWLLGIAAFQQERFADAASTWRLLQPQLAPGSNVAKAVAEQIALAEARAGGAPATASSAPAPSVKAASLQIEVSISPAMKAKVAAGDTLFVYARAEQGPPIPLAVVKLDAMKLPISVVLDDTMAMMPDRKLSSVSRVFVGARISRSGEPTANIGDLQGDAGVVAVDTASPIKVVIDKVH